MTNSLLNAERPPVFCPGCAHERVVGALDKAFQNMGLEGKDIVIVSDIGCSGLFDTFFDTHALHGLHGRALTYATGLKLACPSLTVVTIMGDGGLGIGGAHVLSSCRRNLDINLLVLNNFNYGMTGGQCSATTPAEARTASGFLGQLEAPLDICAVATAAGATWIDRASATESSLTEKICRAIHHPGFSLMDITGVCPGRFSKMNKQAAKLIRESTKETTEFIQAKPGAVRPEYGEQYRRLSSAVQPAKPVTRISPQSKPSLVSPLSVLFLGAAGQRVNTAAEILCLSAMHGGNQATQKNDYPITVLRGHSISEVILSPEAIDYTGIDRPGLIVVIADEAVARKKRVFAEVGSECLIIKAADIQIPETSGEVIEIDFAAYRITSNQRALASLALITRQLAGLSRGMLFNGMHSKLNSTQMDEAVSLINRCLDS